MKAIVTGMNGTVAPVVARHLVLSGHSVVAWDRSKVPTDDPDAVRRFIEQERPDWFFHIATGSPLWADFAAHCCADHAVKFLFTSSVSVFSSAQTGPFTVNALPEPDDDYGRYKLHCEDRVRTANPHAVITRLGWQIGTAPGGNHMVDFLQRQFIERGRIEASSNWYPACSFLEDTAGGLLSIMQNHPAGLYHLDGNPGWNFYEIAVALNHMLGDRWQVDPTTHPAGNNRMVDDRVTMNPITRRLSNARPKIE